MTKPRLRLLDTDAIARHYGIPTGTIRYWAHKDGWTPYGTRRHRQWNLHEAQTSFDRWRGESSCA